jgi:L-threonylcarbamoyladenylate synthase
MQTIISTDIEQAKQHLIQNDVVAIPTETVYGLAANALNDEAVIKIFEAKNRPTFNPLIVHCSNWNEAMNYVEEIPEKFSPLIKKFSPGPITFLLKKRKIISDLVTAGSNYVAIRIPNHPTTLALLASLPFPVAAPSANEFGYISPTTAQHVMNSLQGKIPFILNGDHTTIGLESTIVGINEWNKVVVHRIGGVSIEEIQNELKEEILLDNKNEKPATAGQLKSHYAPHTDLIIGNVQELISKHKGKNICTISFYQQYANLPIENQFILSPQKNIKEAAQKLFSTLREIDQQKPSVILVEIFPNEGIGAAINDRLERAAAIHK